MMEKRLSNLGIILLNYNNSKLTVTTAQSLVLLDSGAKIIVVDNCSTDNSVGILENEIGNLNDVHIVFSDKNAGYATGNNIGIRYAEKIGLDTVLIMNPDIELQNIDTLYEMYDCLKLDESIGAITVKTIFNGKIREPNECAWHYMTSLYMIFGGTIIGGKFVKPLFLKKEKCVNHIITMDVVQGCFFMIRLKTISEAGYLDENTFLYTEESILAKRLEAINKKNAVITDLYVKHNHKEKSKRMKIYKNKIFDMKCYYDSRKYYIKEYSNSSYTFYIIASLVLNIDYFIKKIICKILMK